MHSTRPATHSRPTVAFYTLGCKLNFAETGTIAREFRSRDFDVVALDEGADVAVINTCSVTDEADKKCRKVIRRAIRANPSTFVIVTGCYAQLKPKEIAGISGVDVVLGSSEKFQIFDVVRSFKRRDQTQVSVSCIDDVVAFGPAYSAGERTRAFLKVQDGCDYSCSFCTIPLARGQSRSQSIEDTVRQAEHIASSGFREIVLSGVNIGLFGNDTGEELLELLQRLENVEGIDRYRISSIEPNLLTDEIIEFVAGSKRFMPHFHIPLQSGDDAVLARMRRRYRRTVYEDRVALIRKHIPDAAIGADVIVGFPAETLERFENTVQFIRSLPVTYLHVFTYSERANTAAVNHSGDMGGPTVPMRERRRRNRVLRTLSEEKKVSFVRSHLGTRRRVLWEGKVEDGLAGGFTDNYIRVVAAAEAVVESTMTEVELSGIDARGRVNAAPPEFLSIL